MLFSLAIPSLLLVATVNGAALPQKRATEVQARDLSDILGDVVSVVEQIIPTPIVDGIESFIGDLADPTPTPEGAAPTDDSGIIVFPSDSSAGDANAAAPTPVVPGGDSAVAPTPTGPAGAPVLGLPPPVGTPTPAGSARRSRRRNENINKRIDLSNIVSAVESALPSGIVQKAESLIHDVIPGAAVPTQSSGSAPSAVNNDAASSATPTKNANAARSLTASSPFSAVGGIVVVASVILGAVVAL